MIYNLDGLHKFIPFIPSIFHHPLHNVTFRRVQCCGIVLVQRVFVVTGVRWGKTGGPRLFAASHKKQQVLTTARYLPQQLYGLFKFVTVSHTPNTSRPGLLDFTGKAKWDSWQDIGNKYSTKPDPDSAAQARYMEIARSLGWKRDITTDGGLLVQDKDNERVSAQGVMTGTGVSVSTMSAPKEDTSDDLGTIHGLAIAGDAQKLEEMLKANSSLDLNQKDAFVSVFTMYAHMLETERCARVTLLCIWRATGETRRLSGFS